MAERELLSARIERLRNDRQLTRQQLASRLTVTHVTVWSWERGRRAPSPQNLKALAVALDVPLDVLKRGAEDGDDGSDRQPSRTSQIMEVIEQAKDLISRETGIPANRITITIRY